MYTLMKYITRGEQSDDLVHDMHYVRFSSRFALLAAAFKQSILLTEILNYWCNFIRTKFFIHDDFTIVYYLVSYIFVIC